MTASTCRVCGVPVEDDATACPDHAGPGRSGGAGPLAAPPWAAPGPDDQWPGPPAAPARPEVPPPPPPPPPELPGRKGRLSGARGIGLVLVVIVVGLGVWGATMSQTGSEKAQERVEDYLEGTGRKEFFASDSQFRATFPTYPVRSTETIDAQGTELPITLYTSEGTDHAFSVGTFDLAATDGFDLVGSVNGQAAGVGGRVETSSLTTFAGREAVESVISAPQGVYVKSLVVRSPTRVYLLQVIGRDNPPEGYDQFKGTFEITV